ncbi:hypothetical protein MYU51_011437 [Penicillium brevicompactum]
MIGATPGAQTRGSNPPFLCDAAYNDQAVIHRHFINGSNMRDDLLVAKDLLKERKLQFYVALRDGRDLSVQPMAREWIRERRSMDWMHLVEAPVSEFGVWKGSS